MSEIAMSEYMSQVTDAAFDAEVLQADVPVLLDFWAEWCGPCKAITPILEQVAEEYQGKIKIMKMNVDENKQTPAKYAIRSIPTLILFKEGDVEATRAGVMTKAQLTEFIEENI